MKKGIETRKETPLLLPESRWIRMLSADFYRKLEKMGNTPEMIEKHQKKRVLRSVCMAVCSLPLIFFGGWQWAILPLVLAFFAYWIWQRTLEKEYQGFLFERQLGFNQFARLLVPYLHELRDGHSLYSVLDKLRKRMTNPADLDRINQLMFAIQENPNQLDAFTEFAESMSGSDFSVTFMQTLFDLNQGQEDLQVITALAEEVTKRLRVSMQEIATFKERKLVMYPTKVTLLTIIIILGYAVSVMVYKISEMNIHF